jgi:tetratricopeptide (TPR) repeat protein
LLTSRRLLAALVLSTTLALAGCSSSEDRAKAHFERGSEFAKQGDPVRASLEFRNALQLKSVYPEALFALGTAQEQQGSYADAARTFLAVAEQAPDNVEARVRLTYILLAAGQVDEAAKYADQAYALAASDPTAMVAKAAVALKRGNTEVSITLANEALAARPGFADAIMILASERLTRSDAAGALTFLEQAPESEDKNLGLQMLRLTALDAVGQGPEVEALFIKLIGLFPENPSFREGLVQWYVEKGRIDDAERVHRERVAANPTDDQAQLGLTTFLLEHRSKADAMSDLESAIAGRTTAKADTYALKLALAQLELEDGQAAKAATLTQAVVDETSDAEKRNNARVQLARILVAQEDHAQAETIVDTVIAEDASNVDALSVRASLRVLKGDLDNAIEDLLAALNEAPDNAVLHGLLAEAYERDGSTLLAEEQYTKALDLSKYTAPTGMAVARFFVRNGKNEQAIRALDQVRRNAPQDRDVLDLLAQLKLATQDWFGARDIAATIRQFGAAEDVMAADRIDAAALIGLNRPADSLPLLEAAAANPANVPAVLPDLVNAYVAAGKPTEARDYLQKLLADEPDDVQALILLASVDNTLGETGQIEATLKKAAEGDGLNGEAALAQFYMSGGKFDEADAAIKSGLQQDPKNAGLQVLQAALYERTERFDDAIAVYTALYEQNPAALSTANDLASLLSERRGDAASLARAFEIAQPLRGSEIPQYVDTLGWIYYLRGEYDAALPLLRSAASQLANVALVHYHLGMTYSALDQKLLARTSLERALSITPPLLEGDVQKAKDALSRLEEGETAEDAPKS